MQALKTISTIFSFMILAGCASGSSIVTGTTRPAISAADVKIYLDPPAQYEIIGIVEAASEVLLSATQTAQNSVISELKSQAAKIGANGIILIDAGNSYISGYQHSAQIKSAKGKAIYVLQK